MVSAAIILNYPLSEQIKVGHLDVLKVQFDNMLNMFDVVHVISPRDRQKYKLDKKIIVHNVPLTGKFKYLSPLVEFFYLTFLIKKYNISVVRALAVSSGFVAVCSTFLAGSSVVVSVHTHSDFYSPFSKESILKRKIFRILEPLVYKKAKVVPVISKFIGNYVNKLGITKKKIFLHYNWVDTKFFTPLSYKLTNKTKTLLFVGRASSEKGVDLIINAMPFVLTKNKNVILKIAGAGPELDNLKKLAQNLGVSNNVSFLGRVEHSKLLQIYRTADIFVASISAGFSLIEAQACGLPAVCGSVEWHSEIINDGTNGFLVNPFSPQNFASAIISILADPIKYKQMSKSSREVATSKFDVKYWKSRELEIYRKALNRN